MFDRVGFLLGEALIALRRNAFMTFAAIATISASLFLLGGLAYVYLKATEYAQTLPGKFEMRVFLVDGATSAQVADTAAQIRATPGVASAAWIPRDKAWAKFRSENPDFADVENPLPEAFKVTLSDLSRGDQVAQAIRALPAVRPSGGVAYLAEEQRFIDRALNVLQVIGSFGGGLLFVTAGILIYNAIRLTVLSRRLEIRIMQMVGASRFTVRFPFLLEGLVQGVIGGALAALLLEGAQEVLGQQLAAYSPAVRMAPFPREVALVALGAAGGFYGLVCSYIAVRAPLRFR